MLKRYGIAFGVVGVSVVLSTVLRLIGGGAYTAGLCLTALFAAAVVVLCGAKPKPFPVVEDFFAKMLGVFTVITGAAIFAASAKAALDLLKGVYPYPAPVTVTVLSTVIVGAMLLGGIGGGLVLIMSGVQWVKESYTKRGRFGMAALLPVVWLWGRLVWYMTSFASAVNRFSSLTEAVLLLLEMLFMLQFARYVSGVEEKTPRFAVSLSLCTAMLGLSVCATRMLAVLTQNAELNAATVLITAPDFGIACLAAVFAFVLIFGKHTPEKTTRADDDEEEDTRFVLSEEEFVIKDDEEENEEEFIAEREGPSFEEVLNEVLGQKNEKS